MDGSRPKHIVNLTLEARQGLESITRNGSSSAKKILHARVLLLADQAHPLGRYRDAQIAKTLGVHENTVARVRRLFVQSGEAAALDRKARLTPPTPAILDGAKEATLIAICCSAPPQGRARWTTSLLADELVRRRVVLSISAETVRTTLKKTSCSPGVPNGSAFPKRTRRDSSPRWSRSLTSMPSR